MQGLGGYYAMQKVPEVFLRSGEIGEENLPVCKLEFLKIFLKFKANFFA